MHSNTGYYHAMVQALDCGENMGENGTEEKRQGWHHCHWHYHWQERVCFFLAALLHSTHTRKRQAGTEAGRCSAKEHVHVEWREKRRDKGGKEKRSLVVNNIKFALFYCCHKSDELYRGSSDGEQEGPMWVSSPTSNRPALDISRTPTGTNGARCSAFAP